MANNFIPKNATIVMDDPDDVRSEVLPHMYNVRQCPSCGNIMFGMPGGRDATCRACGFKDPCCND